MNPELGTVYFHYQGVYETLGRKAARAKPSDSGINWAFFRNATREHVESWLEQHNWIRSESGPGLYYSREPWIREAGIGILVTQSWGMDI